MEKQILIGINEEHGKVTVKIELKPCTRPVKDWITLLPVENAIRLSICGSMRGCCGQIQDQLKTMKFKQLNITEEELNRLLKIWDEWHLNDMKPGTIRQEKRIKEKAIQNKPQDFYLHCRQLLEKENLLIDNGYEYGSQWLFAPLPDDVIKFLNEFPSSPKTANRSALFVKI